MEDSVAKNLLAGQLCTNCTKIWCYRVLSCPGQNLGGTCASWSTQEQLIKNLMDLTDRYFGDVNE